MKLNILLYIICLVLISSCAHEPQKYITPNPIIKPCDTIAMSYKKDIKPILWAGCYQCHSDSATENGNLGTDLETFTLLKQYLLHDYRGDSIYGSQFVHVLEHAKLVPDMPPTYILDSCSLGQIRSWIRDGANDN